MKTILPFVVLIVCSLKSACQYNMPDDFAAYAISIDYMDGKSGTGFLYTDSTYLYIVTANHVLFLEDSITHRPTNKLIGDSINIGTYSNTITSQRLNKFAINLKGLNSEGLVLHDEANDIALIEIGKVEFRSNYIFQHYNRFVEEHKPGGTTVVGPGLLDYFDYVKLASDVFVIGYPKSVGLPNQYETDKPLLCRGIIASKNEKNRTLILNAQVYHGNSGGPVFCHFDGTGFRLVGIVTQLIPFASPIYQNSKEIKGVVVANTSSYSIVAPMDFLLPLVNKFSVMHGSK